MKLVYYITDCPVSSPCVPLMGAFGGYYNFLWDQKRSAHTREYDLDNPSDIDRLRIEQKAIFSVKSHYAIYTDIVGESSGEKDLLIAALKEEIESLKPKPKKLSKGLTVPEGGVTFETGAPKE